MAQTTQGTRQNRTLTVDFQDPPTYFELIHDGKAFVEFVFAFILSIGFQLAHKTTCTGGGCLTRHSHYARVRLGGLTIWRIQCTACQAVFTVLPHCALRYRRMRPDVARQALIATHGGLSLAWCATIKNARGTPPFRAGRKGRGPAGATAEPSGGVEAPAFRPGRTSTRCLAYGEKHRGDGTIAAPT